MNVKKKSMRQIADETLTNLAYENINIRLVIADIGEFSLFEKKHADKYINAGVAESNVPGIAAGLASEGMRVYIYGVSGFLLYRAFEQIKYSIAYWKQPVTILGNGFGWKYFNIGKGHFTPDDIAIMRLMPNMEILTPCKEETLKSMLNEKTDKPRYIRLSSDILSPTAPMRDIEHDIILVSYGEMANVCFSAIRNLQDKEIKAGYLFIDSFNDKAIDELQKNLSGKKIIVVEDHCKIGGLGSLLAEKNIIVRRHICLPVSTEAAAETKEKLMSKYYMDTKAIMEAVVFEGK
jgi:transketolase